MRKHQTPASRAPNPRVVACVPAYNAESFIGKTIESLLAQRYPNLKILISDDASQDATLQVCERYAATDSRIQIIRQESNLGWTGNSAALVNAVEGDYFLFVFHDDILMSDFVSRLVEALESNPSAILAYSDIQLVDYDGTKRVVRLDGISHREGGLDLGLSIASRHSKWWVAGHGLYRTSQVKPVGGPKKHLAGEVAADWPWILSLALRGDFVRVPEVLYSKKRMPQSESQSWRRNSAAFAAATLACGKEVVLSKLGCAEKTRLLALLAGLFWNSWRNFPWKKSWRKLRRDATRRIDIHIPARKTIILVDQNEFQIAESQERTHLPFLERNGQYWGPPPNDEVACEELERLRAAGASYLGICAPAFWWLDHYPGFNRRLSSKYNRIFQNESIVLFDIR